MMSGDQVLRASAQKGGLAVGVQGDQLRPQDGLKHRVVNDGLRGHRGRREMPAPDLFVQAAAIPSDERLRSLRTHHVQDRAI